MRQLTGSSSPSPCFEWAAFEGGLPGSDSANLPPGTVLRHLGRIRVLHYAPARWLVPEPDALLLAALGEAETSGRGVLTDVSGRWNVIRTVAGLPATSQDGNPHPLTAGMPLNLYMEHRQVAAVWVFDCPILVVSGDSNLEIWIEASYDTAFRAVLASVYG